MARDATGRDPTRRWLAAAILAAAAMFAWLSWHAVDAMATLEHLRESHARAALAYDSILRLEAEAQRTVQLALVTGQDEWLEQHAEAASRLRSMLASPGNAGEPHADTLHDALAALDTLDRIEARALALLSEGRADEGFALVTGPEYRAGTAALGEAIRSFEDGYHGWLLSHSLGLTRGELVSLAGALLLFATAIAAWVFLVGRLQREKSALLREIDARNRAEAGLDRVQKMELLGQLAGGVAHDVDNTLTAVAGYSSLARRAADDAGRARALEGLDRAVRQGRGVTSNLLSFVRHERAACRPVELGALIRETRAWLAPLLPVGIALEVSEAADGELWVDADPASLQQAFVNLALNARDAMPDGGTLRVSLGLREDMTLGKAGAPGPVACICVADTGCGMDAATLAQAREPLFSTKLDGHGTGLGLPSVERVVAAHGGRLELESAPGCGTQVRLLLPVAGSNASRETRRETAGVVSQDPYSGRLLADALEDAGLDVSVCRSLEAWPSQSGRPAVVVLDWRERVADAVNTLRGLRDAGLAAPVILLLDAEDIHIDPSLEEALTGLALIVSRSVPLGELSQLARRLAGSGDAVRAA